MQDLISRQAAIDGVKTLHDVAWKNWHEPTLSANVVLDMIRELPSADRPQGKWKRKLVDNEFNADWVCSECGYRVKTDFVSFNFCPNCGADMRSEAREYLEYGKLIAKGIEQGLRGDSNE